VTPTKDDTYDDWVDRMMTGRGGKPFNEDRETVISLEGARPFASMEFLRLERPAYIGEVGKRGDDYIFHFYPGPGWDEVPSSFTFADKLGDVFLDVFKNPNQVLADYTEEFGSWAVKVTGFARTVWGDEQALSIFDKLDKALEAK